ncbi:MAG: T9SS type A sorting domain-containing protein, partial [Bacteroidota bacterium]
NPIVTFSTPSATGTAPVSVSCSPASGSTFATGSTSVICTATNSCGNSICSFNVTINETPLISCPGDINGGTNNINGMVQTYAAPSGGSPAVTSTCIPASGSMFPIGTTVVNCNATNSCGTGTCSFNVTITLLCTAPVISACPSNIAQCTNIATWTDPIATGTLPTVTCIPSAGSSFPPGITVVTCTASNACGNDQCSFTVTINQTPVIGACPAPITTCNSVVTYSAPSATGYPTPTVICSPASGSTFAAGTTLVTCIAANTCGSSSCSFNVSVQSASTAATSASANASTICLGNQVTLTAGGGTLGLGASWKWYDGGCGVGASIGTGLTVTITPSTSGVHNYFVRAEGLCNATPCNSVSVNVITSGPSNTIHVTAFPGYACLGNPPDILSVNAANGATFYNFSCSQGGVLFNGVPGPYQSTSPSVNVTFNALPPNGTSGWSICIFAGNPCGNSNTICTWVRATLSKPDSISGSVVGCPGTTGVSYSAAFVGGAASYQWNATGGIVINNNGAQAITVNFPAGFVSGTLSVHGQTACGYNGPNAIINISHIPAIPSAITGTSYPCPNASTVYSIAPVSGAVSYTWNTSVPGAVVTGTSTSCSIAFPAFIPGGSSVSVFANSICPSAGSVRAKGIASGLPNTPSSISGPASGQCGQTGVSYSINPVALATGYNWNTSCGNIVGPVNLSGITVDWPAAFNTCNVTVSVTNNCGTGGTRSLPVIGAPSTPVAILGNSSPCANAVEIYSLSGSSGATAFVWTVPAGAGILGPANGSSILLQWGNVSGNISVRGSNNCGLSAIRILPCVISCRVNQEYISEDIFNAEVFPNPSQGKATLKMHASSAFAANLFLTDGLGRNVFSTEIEVTSGLNMIELDLSTIAKGVYLLRIIGNEQTNQIKLIVE